MRVSIKAVFVAVASVLAFSVVSTTGPAPVASASAGVGSYTPVPGKRILDTRSSTPLGPRSIRAVNVTGTGGVPATGVSAVVVNVTVTQPTVGGYLTVWPRGVKQPNTSSINFPKSATRANLVTVPVGAQGDVVVFNQQGRTHVIFDIVGYYASGPSTPGDTSGFYQDVYSERLLDTRTWQYGPVPANHYVEIPVSYEFDGVDQNPHIKALAVNLTVVTPSRSGYMTAWPNQFDPLPPTSSVNFDAGRTVSNMAIVPVGPCRHCDGAALGLPSIAVVNKSPGNAHLIVDIVGFYDDGTQPFGLYFKPRTPTRIVDSRTGLGTPSRLGPNQTRTINTNAVAGDPTYALVTNTTAIQPTALTYLTLWPSANNYPRPNTSNVNAAPGTIVASHTITSVGPGNFIKLFNGPGYTNVAIDVVGTMEYDDPGALHAPRQPPRMNADPQPVLATP